MIFNTFGDINKPPIVIRHGFGQVTKDPYGLKKRFCNFMDNMMMGPYLSTGRILRKYDEVLDE